MNYLLEYLPLPHFDSEELETRVLSLSSDVLKKNPLGDSNEKFNFILAPKAAKPVPVIFHLSGYYGNGPNSFNYKTLEANFAQKILQWTKSKKIPLALHVFVDGMTLMGGSQFINSDGCGRYGDYIQKELTKVIAKEFSVKEHKKYWALMGSSSGGYGALYHLCQAKSPFGIGVAIAPDSHFESSLLPELYKVSPYLYEYRTLGRIKRALNAGEIQKHKSSFHIMNALAMSLCYGKVERGEIQFPLDLKTGELKKNVWAQWKKKDPISFLNRQKTYLRGKQICLDVGIYDEFSLYFGARQIRSVLKKNQQSCTYSEFEGGHFGSQKRKELALQWLKRTWK